ncbi:hypothetical protein RM549_15320 [Salegentibacter sp. F188]|uniref:Membrane or secreted protein n=1 Tax=Autumnicola patrickiae TaxID=3075591 RepID=A0ABU3E5B2_9FLAO|nr:hypothetical protein [Salegentibacter sp. F188]MDT0691164.1 hypothetical protein [Salegentibacter sp. F188]
MKKLIILPLLIICFSLNAQSLEGSWKLVEENGLEVTDKEVVRIYQDGYFAEGAKNSETNEFLWALGGEYSEADYREMSDFNTKNPEAIGKTFDPKLSFMSDNSQIKIDNVTEVQVWERISSEEDDLSGNWVITGRKRGREMSTMTPGNRRTVKILGGGRFQWIAFNSATREFSGTGGGTYSAEDGKYIENIEFFSRDSNRVGASLDFEYEVRDSEWHHQGKSSKGDPIYEIWSPYSEAYTK